MTESTFPVPTERVIATLVELARHQSSDDLADLLVASRARIEETGYDNLDGGTTYHTLFLEVPISTYAQIESRRKALEQAIESKVTSAIRNTGRDYLTDVSISPILAEPMSIAARSAVPEADTVRLWDADTLRLFVGHVSEHKAAVAQLKWSLRVLGVSAFVAHMDIEPALEWQDEIDRALRSMHAMAALLTPEFHDSKWTDQEVGAALARGVPVVPVALGLLPYGFLGRQQALFADLAKPDDLARAIVAVLERERTTGPRMREALVVAIETANSFASAKQVTMAIESVTSFTVAQLTRIQQSVGANSQVAGSFYASANLPTYVAKMSPTDSKP